MGKGTQDYKVSVFHADKEAKSGRKLAAAPALIPATSAADAMTQVSTMMENANDLDKTVRIVIELPKPRKPRVSANPFGTPAE